jgi:Ca2+-binding RTX toxin-like protein
LIAALAAGLVGVLATAPPAVAGSTVYSVTQTIPVPPASNYAGVGGGDGWDLSMTPTSVYNVFHHNSIMTMACHRQSDASPCYTARVLQDASANNFATSGQAGTWIDVAGQKLYAYGTRSDGTAGVVCADLVAAETQANPFCGFTPLTATGDATYGFGGAQISTPQLVGNRWFAFNYVNGSGVTADRNKLMCFDVTTKAACGGQPYAVDFGTTVVAGAGNNPSPAMARIGARLVMSMIGSNGDQLGCFDTTTNASCAGGSWPIAAPPGNTNGTGAAFPKLSSTGAIQGFCLPSGTDECFDLNGGSILTPAGMPAAITQNEAYNGGALVFGPRVYVPNFNTNQVMCYNANTDASCINFPKTLANSSLLYTVNPDPQRPTCIWTNADNGSAQIQNFDAFTGQACGQGAIRVLAASFVVDAVKCQPASYTSLEILTPPRASYTDGSVAFQDADAQPIPGIPDKALDGTGKVDLSGLNLSTALGLPQFVVNLNGLQGTPGEVVVRLTWTGTDDPACVPSNSPAVDAGPEVTGSVGAALALNGTAKFSKPVTTQWSAPADAPCTFANAAALSTTITCSKVGNYTLTLKGSDGNNSASDTTVAHVTSSGFKCHGQAATIVGTAGADTLVGTSGADVIVARGGNDVVRGGEGNDLICGDAGNDKLSGQGGKDRVYGRGGNDAVTGDKGDDKLGGGRGNDVLRGKSGDDVMRGSSQDDKLIGGSGEDRLMGQTGKDTLLGDEDDDVLVGGKGNDKLSGKAGADDLFGMEGDDRGNGGAGDDEVHGGPGSDRLIGGKGENSLAGGPGHDTCGSAQDGPNALVSCEVAG